MLRFLVTSATRRRLLQLLWSGDIQGSVSELALQCDVSFAGAHRELQAMCDVGLAKSVRHRGRTVYCADTSHPMAQVLKDLVSMAPASSSSPAIDEEGAEIRRRLKALGAPLQGDSAERATLDVEQTLVAGTKLARRDATVASVMPLCFWNAKDSIAWKRLVEKVHGGAEKHALGFFLALTSEFSSDQRFSSCAAMLRDRRMKTLRDFFQGSASSLSLQQAEERTPKIAREWGFRMNMELDSFRSTFDKFAADCDAQ